ncbi:MAG TPA: gluconokinase [Thermomicrobiaceae bacterium]|nr:gluconokinase [Thermomicrobiaceae bacterium]
MPAAGSAYVLAIDVGSSSVRASLRDATGTAVAGTATQLTYEFRRTPDGGAEVDADHLLELVAGAVDQTLARSTGRASGIAAVAASMFWHSVLGVDAAGQPTTPVITWADHRAAGAAAELRARLDEAAVHRRTGCVLHSSYVPAKLLWLSRARPEAFARTARWISPAEYLGERLFGTTRVGTSMASGTGLFDQNGRTWDAEVIAALPITVDQLSPIDDRPLQGLTAPWARRWPALADVPWFPAAGDGACSNVGSGCTGHDRLALMVGTSGAMRVLWQAEHVDIPPGLWCYRPDARRFVMGGALSDGGNLIAWLEQTLRLPDPAAAETAIAAMPPDAHGLTFLPLLNGERGPQWADRANGAVTGMSMATTPLDIFRAALEAVALRFALIAEIIDASLPGERHVVATGGGLLHSPVWTQIMADALGKPIVACTVAEASSRGAALLALEALGAIPSIEAIPAPLGDTFTPDPARHAVYRRALDRQRAVYDALIAAATPAG